MNIATIKKQIEQILIQHIPGKKWTAEEIRIIAEHRAIYEDTIKNISIDNIE